MDKELLFSLYKPSDRLIWLAFFRIYIAFHLLKKILFQWSSLEILYSEKSFVVVADTLLSNEVIYFLQSNYSILIMTYMIVIVLFAFGVGKHFTTILLFILLEIFQRMNGYVLNGGDNLLKFLLFYMIFADSYKYFIISKLKIQNKYLRDFSNLLTNLAIFSILLHVALVYLMSGLHKAHAEVWFNGTATYYTFSLERFAGSELNASLVKNGYFVTLSTYSVLLWELSFIFVIWYRKIRLYFLGFGVLMHLGIYFFMMIHDFFVFIMTYPFFFTDKEIKYGYKWIITLPKNLSNKCYRLSMLD